MDEENEIEEIKRQVTLAAAENMAVQYILVSLLQRLGEASPAARVPIVRAFDDAANNAENFSLSRVGYAGHLPEVLRVIEELRRVVVGKSKPIRDV